MPKKTKVVHCKKEPYDVYIGRGKCPKTGKPSKWGNPFTIGKSCSREEAISSYRKWLFSHLDKKKEAKKELTGKTLGCWCAPLPCHGDVLAEICNNARKN